MVPAAEVLELPSFRRRDDHLAGVRAREGAPDALIGVRVLIPDEKSSVSRDRPAAALVGREPDLVSAPSGDRLAVLQEQREVDTGGAVEALG
jgi:hypothetical protein